MVRFTIAQGGGGAGGSCRGGERVPGPAAPHGAKAGTRSRGHAGHRVRHRPGDGGPRLMGAEDEFREVLATRQRTLGPGPPGCADRPVRHQPRRWRPAGIMPGPRPNSGACCPPPAAKAGARSPGHAGYPVQHRQGDGGARGSCRGRGRVPGGAAHSERKLGPDHPVTLVLWFSIAREMAARGDHAGALKDSSRTCCPILPSGSWARIIRIRWRPPSGSTASREKRPASRAESPLPTGRPRT